MRRQRDHAIATPPSLIARLAKATARAEVFWVEARKANDFKLFAPHLEEVVHLVRDKAALLGQARGLAPVRCAGRRIHAGHFDRRYRHHLQGAVAQAPRPHQSGHRSASRPAAHPPRRQIQRGPPAPAVAWKCSRRWDSPSIGAGSMRASIPLPRVFPATSASPRASTPNDPFSGLLGAVHETGHAMYDLGLAAAVARSAGGPGPRARARGEPVAAVRNESVPQPRLRAVLEAAAGEVSAGERRGMERGQPVPAPDPREAQLDSHGCRRAHLSGAHHAAL